jgi:small subunit ribosomal protein S17
MPKNKKEEEIEQPTSDTPEAAAEDNSVEAAPAEETAAATEQPSTIDVVADVASDVLNSVAETIGQTAAQVVNVVSGGPDAPKAREHKRAERVGVVSSDKMTKTVVVRVDRVVKHPVYRKYVKRRKKLMAHDETGAKVGDKVRIVETRPLSARKRWRVVEIIQKAEL